MSPTENRPIPRVDLTDFQRYDPALRLAQRAIQERVEAMEDRFEPHGPEVWDRAQSELQDLRKLIRTGATDGTADEAR